MAGYHGELPRTPEALQQFKGIGRYTAGAIASFAYGQDAPILDTNVRRLLFRVFIGEGDPRTGAIERRLWDDLRARAAEGAARGNSIRR